ncbi:MAG: hypothetical protein RR386_04935 [Bacteroidaceae bacterium]
MAQEDLLRNFETKLRLLMIQYKSLKKDNDDLYKMLEEKEVKIESLKEECIHLRSNYDNLKLAKMIEISDADMTVAHSRLSKLIRDVDKCISLLNA